MPRTPRNPGSGKPPYNGPARGAGWGGAAKGASASRLVKVVDGKAVLSDGRIVPHSTSPEGQALAEARRQKAMAVIEAVLEAPDTQMVALAAANALLDRVDGKPAQKMQQQQLGADGKPIDPPDTRRPIAELLAEARARVATERTH